MAGSVALADLDDLFRLIAAPNVFYEPQIDRLAGELREYFLESNPPDPYGLGPYEMVLGLGYAVKRSRCGVWLDHTEGPLLQEECAAVIERRVGRPDEFWQDPDSYTDFVWSGSDVGEGLAAFDSWLADDPIASDPVFSPKRLVSVDTRSDFYVAIVCREEAAEELVGVLAGFGVSAELLNT